MMGTETVLEKSVILN